MICLSRVEYKFPNVLLLHMESSDVNYYCYSDSYSSIHDILTVIMFGSSNWLALTAFATTYLPLDPGIHNW